MKRAIIFLTALLLVAGLAMAHEGKPHVMGTVTKVSENSITVKTTAGAETAVSVVSQTVFTKSAATVTWKDLKVGDRVVIHAHKTEQGLQAETVEIGVSKPPAKPRQEGHERLSPRFIAAGGDSFWKKSIGRL
jgi:hypothetical protein